MTVDEAYDEMNAIDTMDTRNEEIRTEKKCVPPDGGWGWFCVLGATLIHLLIGGIERCSGLIYIQLIDKFEGTAADTSWALSLASVLRLLLGPLSSSLCNKFSCRKVVITGGLIASLGVGLSVFATSLWQLYITLGIIRGIGWSFIYTPSVVIVNQYFDKRRGIAVGLAVSGVGIGTFALPPCIELLFEYYGFSGTLLVLTGLQLNTCVCGALFRPPPLKIVPVVSKELDNLLGQTATTDDKTSFHTKDKDLKQDLHNNEIPSTDEETHVTNNLLTVNEKTPKYNEGRLVYILKFRFLRSGKPSSQTGNKIFDISLLKHKHIMLFNVAIGLFTTAFVSFNVFTPALVKSKGLTELQAAYMLSVLGVTDTLGRILSAILDFRSVKFYRLFIFGIILFLTGVTVLILPAFHGFYSFAVVGGFYGFLSGSYICLKSIILVDILGIERVSSAFGLTICFQGVGSLIGPPLSGFLKDTTDSFDQTYFFLGGVVILGALILFTANLVFVYCKDKKCIRCINTQSVKN